MKCFNIFKISLFLLVALAITDDVFATASASYTIHCASYKTPAPAQNDVKKMTASGYSAFVSETEIKGRGKWYRVLVGQYDSKEKAATVAREMEKANIINTYFIITVPANNVKKSEVKVAMPAQASAIAPVSPSKIVVIGNKDSKRYHLTGMPFYNKVKKHHRVYFASEQQAIDNGYYKAGTIHDSEEPTPVSPEAIKKKTTKAAPASAVSEKKFQEALKKNEKMLGIKTKDVSSTTEEPLKLIAENTPEKTVKQELLVDEFAEPPSDSALYNKALAEMKDKKYELALASFKEFVKRDDTKNEWGERALRHMADCHYYLGEVGSKEDLLMAIEFYRNAVKSFPDPRRQNALAYYRLGKINDKLRYHSEAIKYYESVITKYPDTPYGPDAALRSGELSYEVGKFSQAAEKLIKYLMKYKGNTQTKKAFYLIAHSYYKAKQSANAEIWLRDTLKKWPDLLDVPKDMLFDFGQHKISLRRFDEAIQFFSFYANMYPDDDKIKEALTLLTDSYKAAGQYSAALAILNFIIKKYPDSKEAAESTLAMAALGIDKPGLRVFAFLNNMQYYKHPLDTYDTVLMKNPSGEIAENAMLKKGDALRKLRQERKAADVYLEYLNLFAGSKKVDEARRGLKAASAALIAEYYNKKDYVAVAYIYFKAYTSVRPDADEYPQVLKMVHSLQALGLNEDYVTLLESYRKVAKDEKSIGEITVTIAEGYMAQAKYDEAEKNLLEILNRKTAKNAAITAAVKKNLAEISYRKGMYDKAIANYDSVVRSGEAIKDPAPIYYHYAQALREKKENSPAVQNYLTAIKYYNQESSSQDAAGFAYKEVGDIYLKTKNYQGGLDMYRNAAKHLNDPELKTWSKFSVGQTYMKMDKKAEAQSTFAQIKTAAGPEGFWAKVIDYYVDDNKWWEKYGEQVKKP